MVLLRSRDVDVGAGRGGTYWGRRAIPNSIACSRDRIATVGARSGGAHGNPRVTTLRMDGDTLVGAGARTGQHLDQEPLAWTSPDGLTWTPEEMPAEDGVQDVHRVVPLDDDHLLAVGRSEDGFAAWVRDDDGWGESVSFGEIAEEWRGAPYVASLVPTPLGVMATVSTGDHYELWQTDDDCDWQRVDVPLEPPTAGDHTLVAAAGGSLLVVGDAGDGGLVWVGETVSP